MKIKVHNVATAAGVALAMLFATPTHSEILLQDSFESGNMSATNSDGFRWSRNNRTSIVTEEAAVYNNGEIYNPPPHSPDWTAKHGDHSLRFRYPAGQPMSEQRFSLGGSYKEIWFRYWIRVPDNYNHPSSSPSNNKFFAVWMDEYSSKGDGPTAFWNLISAGSGDSTIAYSYSEGSYSVAGPQSQLKQFISVPEDRGRWMQVVIHVRASTRSDRSDGVIELWRRWENESKFTKYHEDTSARLPIPGGGPQGWSAGYIMGWANAAYREDTEWLLDQFTVSTTSLLDGGESAAPEGALPNPPELNVN